MADGQILGLCSVDRVLLSISPEAPSLMKVKVGLVLEFHLLWAGVPPSVGFQKMRLSVKGVSLLGLSRVGVYQFYRILAL